MAVVMKIAHQRNIDTHAVELFAQGDDLACRIGCVHGHAHDLGACLGQCLDLNCGADWIGRVCIGHRLDHHRLPTTNPHGALTPGDGNLTRDPPGQGADRHRGRGAGINGH